MNNYIAIDLGGTSLRVARVSEDFKIEDIIKIDSDVKKGVDYIIDNIVTSINALKTENTQGVGLSVPGQIDLKKNIILHCTNIGFENTPIGEIVMAKTGLQVVMNNDANVAGLGEAVLGAAMDCENSYYLTWSTGIGGALIVDKKIINGPNLYSGEVGNIIIHSNDEYKHSVMCPGALEGLTSGTALARYAEEFGFSSVGDFFEAYKNNNQDVIDKVDYVADNFARAIATIMHVVEVDKIIIGGGVSLKSGDILLPIVKQKLNKYFMPIMHDKIKIDTALLGDEAGLYGSAYLVKSILGEK